MTTIPKAVHQTIYLQVKDEDGNDNENIEWCEDRQHDTDLEYRLVEAKKEDNLILNIKLYDGHPFIVFTVNEGYTNKGGETELLQDLVTAIKRWRENLDSGAGADGK